MSKHLQLLLINSIQVEKREKYKNFINGNKRMNEHKLATT